MSSNYSDASIRARHARGLRASKKNILYQDFPDDCEEKEENNVQRSISLTALQAPPTPTSPLQPRMAQLETLEAKMASIEVSLSTTPRRKNGKKSANGSISGKPGTPKTATLAGSCKELEMLRRALRDKENTIQTLQGQVVSPPRPLDASERRAAEMRLQNLRAEEDMRRGNIARVGDALQKIDSNENNIDVRIRQAELEYELGREELALLGVREEKRAIQASLDAKPSPTLFSCLQPPGRLVLQAVTIECDPKSPQFGAGNGDDHPGLVVQWATEESGLKKGDRIVEVNGKLTLSTSREELSRLLAICPVRAELVVCRVWTPPPSPDEALRRENLRLTHRISYLEDQVTELLSFKEKALTPQVEVFQKGSQVTVLSSPETTRTRRKHSSDALSDSDGSLWRKNNQSEPSVGPSQQYQDGDSYKPTFQNDKIRVVNRRCAKEETSASLPRTNRSIDTGISTVYIHNTKVAQSVHSLSDLERTSRRRVPNVDYNSEATCPRYRSHRDRSVKSLDLDADTSGPDTLTRHPKPDPPRKPLRLSIQRATSLQSMQLAVPGAMSRRLRHKGAAPQPPNGLNDSDIPHNGYRWPADFHRNKGRTLHMATTSKAGPSQEKEEKEENRTFECNICLDTAKDAVVSMCGHLFCWPCLHQWLETKPNKQMCPVCKAAISKEKVIPLYGRGSTQQEDPRNKVPPRPAGQRTEPENNGAFPGFGFGDGNFHMSFGIGAFPFAFFTSSLNFGEHRPAVPPRGTPQYEEEQFLSKVFLWVAFMFIFWLLLA